jgi:hypothetical protein
MLKIVAVIITGIVCGIIGWAVGAPDTLTVIGSGIVAISVTGLFPERRTIRTAKVANSRIQASADAKEYTVYVKALSRGAFITYERRVTVGAVNAPDYDSAQREAAAQYGRGAYAELAMR